MKRIFRSPVLYTWPMGSFFLIKIYLNSMWSENTQHGSEPVASSSLAMFQRTSKNRPSSSCWVMSYKDKTRAKHSSLYSDMSIQFSDTEGWIVHMLFFKAIASTLKYSLLFLPVWTVMFSCFDVFSLRQSILYRSLKIHFYSNWSSGLLENLFWGTCF